MEFGEPIRARLALAGRTLETYTLRRNRVEVINVGKHGGAIRAGLFCWGSEPPPRNSQGLDVKLATHEAMAAWPLPVSS